MPAARQASRSSAKALAVSAMIGVRAVAALGLGGADAPRRFQAVDARHVHVHQHQVVGRAGGARRVPALERRGAALAPWSAGGRAASAARASAAR